MIIDFNFTEFSSEMCRRGVEIGHENLVDYDARFSTLSKGKNLWSELANCASL